MADQVNGLLSGFLRAKRIRAALPFIGQGRVLDFGCGIGELAHWIDYSRYTGVDVDAESLALASARHTRHKFMSPTSLEPEAQSRPFDIIVALAVIEHLSSPTAWLRDAQRMLSPGGRIVITTPHPRIRTVHTAGARIGLFSKEGAKEHHRLLDRKAITASAAQCGLAVLVWRRFLLGCNQLCVLGQP